MKRDWQLAARATAWLAGRRWSGRWLAEWLLIAAVAWAYSGEALLDFDPAWLQQTGEHNESATLPILAEIGLRRYGEIPLWNPYMLTGYPHAGDFINHFWHPISTLPILIWGGVNGMKVSIFLAFVLAGWGQWTLAHVFGVRGLPRLWAGLLFMLSGGLALLWRVGWYELLLGQAWFPWAFAAWWQALARRDRASVVGAGLTIAMILTTGGGYYPFYLLVGLAVLLGMRLLAAPAAARWPMLWRALGAGLLGAALSAVALLPYIDGYRFTIREAGQDLEQRFSQPIVYALLNYVISQPDWFRTEILGTAGGWNWFYIGALPLGAALLLAPLAYAQARGRRWALATLTALTLVLLVWHANRFTPVRYLYDWIPFLYNLRFPNRLLILAASPLILLGALGLQHLSALVRALTRGLAFTLAGPGRPAGTGGLPVRWLWTAALALTLAWQVRDVFTVNQSFAFAARPRNAKAAQALAWLKSFDPGLYYTQIGGFVYWDWTPTAYELEMPIINFNYGRHLASQDEQRAGVSPVLAAPRYVLALPENVTLPAGAEMLRDFEGVGLWRLPDSLPYAFSAAPDQLAPYAPALTPAAVNPVSVRLAGPNRVQVSAAPARAGDQLVVLMSDYPGWRLYVDGQPAPIVAVNHYLGAALQPGEHTYLFVFEPLQHTLGLAITVAALLVAVAGLAADLAAARRASRPALVIPGGA